VGTVAAGVCDGVVGVDGEPPQPVSADAKANDRSALVILMVGPSSSSAMSAAVRTARHAMS